MKLNLGCGPDRIDGFIGCDIIPGPSVDVVCSIDKLPFEDCSIEEIVCEHVIEHLTFEQANRAIEEWYRVLQDRGKLTIECPDLLGICKQFVESNEYGRYWSYKGYWAVIHCLYGHQRGKSNEEKFSQIHKSGYTVEHLSFMLEGVGFSGITEETPVYDVPFTSVLRVSSYKGRC